MPLMYLRGGIPSLIAGSASTSDYARFDVRGGNANAVIIKNTGSNPIKVAFSQEMAESDHGWTVAASSETVLLPAEFGSLYVKSQTGASTFEALVFVRRG